MQTIDETIYRNILQRKLNEAEQRATELEALFIMAQNELVTLKKELETNETEVAK